MKKLFVLVLVSLVLGCVTSYSDEISVGVNGSASFNKTFGTPTTTQAKKAVTTTVAKKAVPTTTLAKKATTTTVKVALNPTTTTQVVEVPASTGITLTFTPDKETLTLSDEFQEFLEFSPLDITHNYSVVVRMYSPGGNGDGGDDINMVSGDPWAYENGIMNYSFGMTITPFTHDESGFEAIMDNFAKKGVYHYDISVLDCTQILEATGEANCGRGAQLRLFEWEKPDGWKGKPTVFHLDKVVTVT
jgi:hypothetical protein